jgi:hypothetical protein
LESLQKRKIKYLKAKQQPWRRRLGAILETINGEELHKEDGDDEKTWGEERKKENGGVKITNKNSSSRPARESQKVLSWAWKRLGSVL